MFSGITVTTILWTDRGFTPSSDDVSVGDDLREELIKSGTLSLICKELDISECNIENMKIVFDSTMGISRIKLGKLRDVTFNSMKINTLAIIIYVSYETLNMKCKITTTIDIRLSDIPNRKGTSSEISNILSNTYVIGEKICRIIHDAIPSRFDLGAINYISNISCIESDDSFINELLDSIYNPTAECFEVKEKSVLSEMEMEKLAELYYVLMTKPNYGLKKIHADQPPISTDMRKYAVKQTNLSIPSPMRITLQAKTLNFVLLEEDRFDNVPHRIISNLTRLHCGNVIATNLASNYLSIT